MEKVGRIFRSENQSFFLLGPRGTGKSTLIKDTYPNALYIDLLLPDVFRNYAARPERLRESVHGHEDKKVVVIDEIQKIPPLLEVVPHLMEEKRGVQFILTGSSARKLKRTGVNLLSGRALMRHMHPFMAAEMKERFRLTHALEHGMLPVVLDSADPVASLHAYVDLYIREEVQMEGMTRNIGNFSRFLEAASFSHGSVLNVTNIARECQIGRKVVESYLQILEDLLLSFRIPVFTKRAQRAVTQHPKFYFFDTGVYSILRPSGPLDRTEEKSGAALEGLIAQHLRAWIDYRHPDSRLYFWRTGAGTEIDFILYGKDLFWAIEVKNGATIRPEDIRPLKTFGEDYPEAKRILVYRGKEKLMRDGILLTPCTEFLMELA
ncbi:MAG: ATP-binding protein [Nitrospirae bacterium]|nr:ATP-binding protein [Nitrospirota bacterium]